MNQSSFCPISFRRYGIGVPRPQRVTGNWGLIPEREPERRLPHLRKAAGAQITQWQFAEVATRNNCCGLRSANGNEVYVKPTPSNNWRASLVPAAAVTPAPIAYIKVVALKKLVVRLPRAPLLWRRPVLWAWSITLSGRPSWTPPDFYCWSRSSYGVNAFSARACSCEQIRVFQAGALRSLHG